MFSYVLGERGYIDNLIMWLFGQKSLLLNCHHICSGTCTTTSLKHVFEVVIKHI